MSEEQYKKYSTYLDKVTLRAIQISNVANVMRNTVSSYHFHAYDEQSKKRDFDFFMMSMGQLETQLEELKQFLNE